MIAISILSLFVGSVFAFNTTSLHLSGKDPKLQLPNYSTGLSGDSFVIETDTTTVLTLDENDSVYLDVASFEAKTLQIDGDFSLGGIRQWKLIHNERFEEP
jgi:hypothetical protein